MSDLDSMIFDYIKNSGVAAFIMAEEQRQAKNIELIASENYPSDAVRAAMASCAVCKYAEGYPYIRTSGNKGRYYGGTENIDALEEYCCDAWRKVFKTNYHVNVQPHCGSSANMAAYMAVLEPGDTILSMELDNGGHLTHGSPVNFSGKLYNFVFYGMNEAGTIDYDAMEQLARAYRPKLILAGASAYSRTIDFERFASAAAAVGAYFMVDMAHIAGLIAAGDHPSPFGLADIITTTTHKTLRGPRGGMIFCKPELAKKVDSAIFPGSQGGPLENIIAAKAICAEEDVTPEYYEYIHNVVKNCRAMCDEFVAMGYKVVAGGTDNHMFLLDLTDTGLTGKEVQNEMDEHNITLNKNCIPGEKRSPAQTSGVRIGTAPMTTKGYTADDFRRVAREMDVILKDMQRKKAAEQ